MNTYLKKVMIFALCCIAMQAKAVAEEYGTSYTKMYQPIHEELLLRTSGVEEVQQPPVLPPDGIDAWKDIDREGEDY